MSPQRGSGNQRVKFAEPRRYADPAAAARRLLEIASTVEPVHGYRNRDRSRAFISAAVSRVRKSIGLFQRRSLPDGPFSEARLLARRFGLSFCRNRSASFASRSGKVSVFLKRRPCMALLLHQRKGGSATGVLITDKSHVPGGDGLSVRLKWPMRKRQQLT